ncbi:MAG: YIP1 family protein [Anaerolineales bacterium]|nr:YIP1 family protein [Anaerolineales bacterium]
MESPNPENTPKMALPRFLAELIVKPKQAFTRLDQTGRPHFLWTAAAMLAVVWLAAIVTLPVTQREAAAGYETIMETGGNFSEEQRAVMEQSMEFSTNPLFLVGSQGIVETISWPILWLSAAGLLYLLSIAFGGQARFGSVLSMAVWATVPLIFGKLMLMIGTLASGATPQPGLSYLVSVDNIASITPAAAALSQILSRVTIFEIWYLVLIGIGIGVCAKVTRPKSAVITILYWLISLIPPVAMTVVSALIASATLG